MNNSFYFSQKKIVIQVLIAMKV